MKYRIEIEVDDRLELSMSVFWKKLKKTLIKSFGWYSNIFVLVRRYEGLSENDGTISWIEMENL